MDYDGGGRIVDFNGTPKKLFDELAEVVVPEGQRVKEDTTPAVAISTPKLQQQQTPSWRRL